MPNLKINNRVYTGVTQVKIPNESNTLETFVQPSGSKSITANGTHDVAGYASAVVNVPSSASGSQTITENGTYDVTSLAEVIVNVAGGAVGIVSGTVTVESGNKITIPKADGKTKLAFFLEGDAELLVTGRATGGFLLPYLSESRVYSIKDSTSTTSPPSLTIGAIPTTFVSETSSSVTITLGNSNTTGIAPVGYTVRYFWW